MRLLVVGDAMLDVYVHGRADRITHESGRPTPVLTETSRTFAPGGAANAACCAAALGASVDLVAARGRDDEGDRLAMLVSGFVAPERSREWCSRERCACALRTTSAVRARWLMEVDRPTTVKTRYAGVAGHLLRVDRERVEDLAAPNVVTMLFGMIDDLIEHVDAVLISDYAKGVITAHVVSALIARARGRSLPVIVDPKAAAWGRYRDATVLTPNLEELCRATTPASSVEPSEIERVVRAIDQTGAAVLVTKGADGMTLYTRSHGLELNYRVDHLLAHSVTRPDAIGAGDAVSATMAVALGSGVTLFEAARRANAAAAVVVGKRGTATATPLEVDAVLGSSIAMTTTVTTVPR